MPLGAFKSALFGASADLSSAMLLSTATASDDASIEFTLPTAYKQVKFGFYNINPAADDVRFRFQVNATGNTLFGETITSATFNAYHRENDTGTPTVAYADWLDQAQGTSYQDITDSVGPGSDESCAGELHLFNPSSAYVKHFYSRSNAVNYSGPYTIDHFSSGYINTTSAIDEISFKMSSGNFDGTIKMYGVG